VEGQSLSSVLAAYAAVREKVPQLPQGYDRFDEASPFHGREEEGEMSLYLARKEYKEEHRYKAVWEGEGPLGERMNALGCVARPSFWYSGGEDRPLQPPEEAFALRQAFIATWHRLDEPTVDHCLFKALLVALGLHPTEGFFFKEGPVTPAEQARALAALQLVYHPAVKPGMTKDEFVATLLAEGLIDR
jgi:hypothetical protein